MAAYDNPVLVKSHDAGADLSAAQFKAVKYNGSGNLVVAGAGESACGLLQNDPALGQTGDVMLLGISRAIAGDAVAKGAKLAADAQGRLVTAASGDHVVAIAQDVAAAAGDIIPVLVCLGGAPLA